MTKPIDTKNRAITIIEKVPLKKERRLEYPKNPAKQKLLDYIRSMEKPMSVKQIRADIGIDLNHGHKNSHLSHLCQDGYARKFCCPTCGNNNSLLIEATKKRAR